jgi:hypothetical protein
MISTKPAYGGWRMDLQGPVVVNLPSRWVR